MKDLDISNNKQTRRHFLKQSCRTIGAISLGVMGCSAVSSSGDKITSKTILELSPVLPVSFTTATGIKVHGIQTGWVSIKTHHYHMRGPAALKDLNILMDTQWTEAKPILSWVIEHPEGLIIIDTGERSGAVDLPTYFTCADAANRFFITRNFRVNVEPESELGPQLVKLGLSPKDVRWCIQTHLHFDHANGFEFFPQTEVLVSRAELEGHRRRPIGAVACKYPSNFSPIAIDYVPKTYGTFAQHYQLTKASDVILVPTPGHSYGHQSVILNDDQQSIFFAGDVVYDERQLLEDEVSGINVGIALTRQSMTQTRVYLASTPTVFLPSHDPLSLTRLQTAQRTTLAKESHANA